ncbi:MAG TPA: TetR/AcrR family transcriptional regulator [Anaerovoracaceae bacterium]|nr:TetR/AcrR family transcriptional regulator [Anaerovoracaceae bacterium]
MSQDSQRVLETKDRIRDAFFELYATKKIERISIKEITEKAQLNRGTFYVYYKDIYDLLETTEDELIEELVEKIKGILTMILRDEDVIPFLPPLEFYERYSKLLRSLFGPNGDPNFVHKIKKIIKKTLREIFRKEQLPQVENLEYVMEYISSAQIGIISYWLVENNMELPVPELGNMIKQITLHGPVGYLKYQIDSSEGKQPEQKQ